MRGDKFKKNVYKILLVVLFANISLVFVARVDAATIIMQPSSTKVDVNNLFTIRVLMNTQDKFANNAEATISFPSDLVEVVSVNSKSSIFGLWVEQPNFSNDSGAISFNGGITNPGYNGSGGQLLSIVFKAKKAGVASLFFSGAAIRENDGLGTDILSGQNSVNVSIGTRKEEVVVPETPVSEPTKPVSTEPVSDTATGLLGLSINSPTHPDQNLWYPTKDASFVWKNPAGLKSLQILLSRQSNITPSKSIGINIEKRDVLNIDDGISYFHIRYQTNKGWSEDTAYKLQIDSQPPYNLSILSKNENDGRVTFQYSAQDDTSSINGYELIIDKKEPIKLPVVVNGIYTVALSPGLHDVLLVATDKAGNKAEYKSSVNVFATLAPEISYYTQSVENNSPIYARGLSAFPNAHINITLKSPHGIVTDYDVITDEFGNYKFRSAPLNDVGSQEMWARVVNADGTKGPVSQSVKFQVIPKLEVLNQLKEILSSSFEIVVFLILLLISITGISWYKFFVIRRQYIELKKQMEDAHEKKNISNKVMPTKKSTIRK